MARNRFSGQEWFDASERSRRREDAGRAELARLGLLSFREEEIRAEGGEFARDAVDGKRRRRATAGAQRWALSRPVDMATGVGVLVGAALIASLAGGFG